MKKKSIAISCLLVLFALVLCASPVMAGGKPPDVIASSNGFPSGQHFNLNIHGRDPATFTGDPGAGGNSVFVAITGNSTIQYMSNKNNKNTELTVLDPLSEVFDGDPADVYLPYNIWVDTNGDGFKDPAEVVPADGYYVYGRILAMPNNGSGGSASSILMYPTFVVAADNSTDNATWPLDPDYDLLTLGFISSQGNLYRATPEGFVRFDPAATTGRGKSTGKRIDDLFYWSGYLSDNASLDTNLNGYLDPGDVPALYDTDLSGAIEQDEFLAWLDYLVSIGQAYYYPKTWVFDIAEMVVAGQILQNDGTKLLQVRFYPRVTTTIQ